jgi:hypothetical protein
MAKDVIANMRAAQQVSFEAKRNKAAFPVSDQSPGITGPVNLAMNDDPSVQHFADGGLALSPDMVALGAGFASPRSRDLMAQRDFQKASSVEVLGGIDGTLRESLGVQRRQLEVMTRLLQHVVNKEKNKLKDINPPPVVKAPVPVIKPPTEMRRSPVSMEKRSYASTSAGIRG